MENNIFISKIEVTDFLHLGSFKINISQTERKHIFITGKNGSGKTSFLRLLDNSFTKQLEENNHNQKPNIKTQKVEFNINKIHNFGDSLKNNYYIYKYFSTSSIFNPDKSKSIEPVNFETVADLNREFSKDFVKFLFFQDYRQKSFKKPEAEKIENWFKNITTILQKIYKDDNLELEPNIEINDFDFYIKLSNGNRFNFNQLASGYSSILKIVIELLLRTEICESKYLTEGIVLIDEPESHLHIELQKEIMPFLTLMFPNIQFIIATHSPFILNSVENAIIYDLENRILIENLSKIPYNKLVDKYLSFNKKDVEHYNNKINEYIKLVEKENRTPNESEQLSEIDTEINKVIYSLSDEYKIKFRNSQNKIYNNA